MDFFPPSGIECVATALEGEVGEITLIDLRVEQEYHEFDRLKQFISQQIDLICVSMNWYFYVDQVCNLLNLLPADIPLIVGGRYATHHVEELFQRCPNIDMIVRGEGEESIQEIAQKRRAKDILGISYRENGRIKHNPNRPLPPFETLPYPNRELRRIPYYIHPKGITLFEVEFDTVFSSRGCDHTCQFCTHTINASGQKWPYTARPPESVVAEIRGLRAEVIYFKDENFFADPERAERICDLLIEQDIRKILIAQARLEIYTYPSALFEKFARAGFKAIHIGIESPHDRILQQYKKGFLSEDIRKAFQVLRQYPFFYTCYFICGNIGETRAEMLSIAPFAKKIGADSIMVYHLQAKEFSPLKKMIEETPGYYIDAQNCVCSDTYNMDALRRIRKEIYKKFYTPAQMFRILKKLYTIRVFRWSHLLTATLFLLRFAVLGGKALAKKLKKKRGGRKKGIPYA